MVSGEAVAAHLIGDLIAEDITDPAAASLVESFSRPPSP
jgi:hypothetical protein